MSKESGNWPKVVRVGNPGGFCAGVERSVDAYRSFMKSHEGKKIYSVGEPAHNPHVNQEFLNGGMQFVESIDEVPDDAPVIFGPHAKTRREEASASLMNLNNPKLLETQSIGRDYLFTVCPLVTKVDKEIEQNTMEGFITIYYGLLTNRTDKNGLRIPHPETAAAMQAGNVRLITNKEEALSADLFDQIDNPDKVAFASQTTHNAEEAVEIGNALQEIFPKIRLPKKEDTCYATRNRQLVVKSMEAEVLVVVGDVKTSSNTRSLIKAAESRGLKAFAANNSSDLKPEFFEGVDYVGIEASASAPKEQIDDVKNFFTSRGSELEDFRVYDAEGKLVDESKIHFPLPRTNSAFRPQFIWSDPNRF